MKRRFMYSLLAVLALVSCQTKELDDAPRLGSKHFTATIEDKFNGGDTRTYIDENGNVRWKQGDQVSIFAGSTVNEQYRVTDISDGKTSADFNAVSGSGFVGGGEIDNNVAFYPYASRAEIAKSGSSYVISDIALPAIQNYAEASFDNGAFPMAAVTSSTTDLYLKFKNLLGGLKLQLKGTASIASISVTGNQNEVLCGAAAVTVSNGSVPAINLTDVTAKTVTLDCGEGVQLNAETATQFVIALPPMTMEGGFTVVVTDTEGMQMEIQTTKTQTINRSNLLRMPAVDYAGEDLFLSLPPVVGDVDILSVGYNKASVQSSLVSDGNATTDFGFYYGTSIQSMTKQTVASGGTRGNSAGAFSSEISNLNSGTTYYVKSYATNEKGTVESAVVTFTTASLAYYENGHLCGYGVPIVQKVGSTEKTVVWAPVNLGYYDTSNNQYSYGRFYQWGRIAGQGYAMNMITTASGDLYTYTDEKGKTVHVKVNRDIPLTAPETNTHYYYSEFTDWDDDNEQYYTATAPYWNGDWTDAFTGDWNNLEKDDYIGNPCPDGWRIPSSSELSGLIANKSSFTTVNNQKGYYFYGLNSNGNRVFFPASGVGGPNPSAKRGTTGRYWDSWAYEKTFDGGEYWIYRKGGGYMELDSSGASLEHEDPEYYSGMDYNWASQTSALSIRCIMK